MTVHEMTLTRLLDAPADTLFRCWTTPELMRQWFAPKPYTTPVAEGNAQAAPDAADAPADVPPAA